MWIYNATPRLPPYAFDALTGTNIPSAFLLTPNLRPQSHQLFCFSPSHASRSSIRLRTDLINRIFRRVRKIAEERL